MSDIWVGHPTVHLSGHNCMQMSHTGLARFAQLSGLCTYPVLTAPGNLENFSISVIPV